MNATVSPTVLAGVSMEARMQLATAEVARGRPTEATAILDETWVRHAEAKADDLVAEVEAWLAQR